MARGVQGMMDLTVPGGGWSVSGEAFIGSGGEIDERRELGCINRIL